MLRLYGLRHAPIKVVLSSRAQREMQHIIGTAPGLGVIAHRTYLKGEKVGNWERRL